MCLGLLLRSWESSWPAKYEVISLSEERRFPSWQSNDNLAAFTDYTLVSAEAGAGAFLDLCSEAVADGYYGVCVSGGWVRLCRERLSGTKAKVSAVVGFPLGTHATRAKAFEASAALDDGASEIDMVLPIGRLADGDYDSVERDIAAVVQAVQGGALVKVILETGMLTEERITAGAKIAEAAGADYVQTSTGFGGRGASVSDIALIRSAVSIEMGIKASGGIRNAQSAIELLAAGANRIGSSSGKAIVHGLSKLL
ncbi:deoxyribose-phosphate aldolase [Cohnella herbarum]|uniref:Deoxyribose-phosphate aldolase n=2 Tax=Cohnella herbarum TaxID=2728023 RepID=A0A7Z2VRD8_9BACL|nr:deoxyribose-phosphate aldolase [Cohnella herbarum]